MRVLTAFSLLLAASAAQASSIITVDQTQRQLNSLIDYLPPQKTDPDVVVEGAKVLTSSPSIIDLGTPAPASETETPPPAVGPAASAKQPAPVVMRGGLIGGAFPAPPPVPVAAEPPLLDPNDAGTPAKRKALKEQARRLQEAAEAGAPAEPAPDGGPEIVETPAQ